MEQWPSRLRRSSFCPVETKDTVQCWCSSIFGASSQAMVDAIDIKSMVYEF